MYSGPLPGSGPMSRLPPPQSHLGPPHEHRHRRGSTTGHSSQATSPAMSSLQRPPYDERDAGRGPPMGPPSQFGGGMGPGSMSVGRPDHRSASTMSARGAPPQMLTGPGAAGMHGESLPLKERERHERDREREREKERERERESRSLERREREAAREREMYEAEREKHRNWERERHEEKMRERERREGHDYMSGMLGGGGNRMSEMDREREREWLRRNHHMNNVVRVEEQPAWTRFAAPREDPRELEVREMERQRLMEIEKARMREEERRAREQIEMEKVERMNRQISRGREREAREKERSREAAKEAGRERMEKSRRGMGEDHGWLPEPRAPEGWPQDIDRERERHLREQAHHQREREHHEREREREFAAREREEMEMRNQHPGHHHHHLHHHHHRHSAPSSAVPGRAPGHIVTSKSGKMSRQVDPNDGAVAPGAGLPAPFDKAITNLPPPASHKHSKTPIATTPIQSMPPQMMPAHFHPSSHLHMPHHPHAPPPLGFQDHRPTSPPFKNALTAPRPNIAMQSRSPRPPILPTLKPRHLGTFVYPRLPFPFLDFPTAPSDPMTTPTPITTVEKETREIHATVIIPSGFIPTEKPRHPRIWGGALIPSFSPLFATPQLITHLQSGLSYGFVRPHPYEIHGVRRVYTDDSDMFLCALHAGWITWSMARKARAEKQDLRLEVRLSRESRYPGGLGSRFMGAVDGQDTSSDDDGSTLLSAGWGNSHDGAGVEIMRADFVKPGTARKLGLRNRAQRISEYSERASALGCMSPVRKRRKALSLHVDDCEEYDVTPACDLAVCTSRTVVLGFRKGSSKTGFRYDPDVVKGILFPADGPPRKKARLSNGDTVHMDVDEEHTPDSNERTQTKGPASIVVETLSETLLIRPQDALRGEDKENAVDALDDGVRYTISLVRTVPPPPPSPKAVATEPAPDRPPGALSDASATTSNTTNGDVHTSTEPSTEPQATEEQRPAEGAPGDSTDVQPSSVSTDAPTAESKAEPAKVLEGEDKDKPTDAPKADDGAANKPSLAEEPAPSTEAKLPEAKPEDVAKEQPAIAEEDVAMADASLVSPVRSNDKPLTQLEVLQRDVGQDDLLFDALGISVLSNQIENGMRRGWKIEAKSWRWATAELSTIAS